MAFSYDISASSDSGAKRDAYSGTMFSALQPIPMVLTTRCQKYDNVPKDLARNISEEPEGAP
jgi:hypothetical protein